MNLLDNKLNENEENLNVLREIMIKLPNNIQHISLNLSHNKLSKGDI